MNPLKGMSWIDIKRKAPFTTEYNETEYQINDGFLPTDKGFLCVFWAEGTNFYLVESSKDPKRKLGQLNHLVPCNCRLLVACPSENVNIAKRLWHWDFRHYETSDLKRRWFCIEDPTILEVGLNLSAIVATYGYISDLQDNLIAHVASKNTLGNGCQLAQQPKDFFAFDQECRQLGLQESVYAHQYFPIPIDYSAHFTLDVLSYCFALLRQLNATKGVDLL